MADTNDLPLTVPAAPLMEHFACPICFEHIQKSLMCAPCGHHFCGPCISECVNRKHSCPCCNAAVAPGQLIADHQYDTLSALIMEEKTKSEKEYFDHLLFKQAMPGEGPKPTVAAGADPVEAPLSAIEDVFRTHLRDSLANFRAYFQELQKRNERFKAEMPADQHAKMDAVLRQNVDLLVGACDQFLVQALPKPQLLPVPVVLVVPERNYRAHNVIVKPGDTAEVLRSVLRQRMLDDGLKIVDMDADDDDALFELMDPTAPVPLQPRVDIMLQHPIPPLAELVFHGKIVLKEDLPKQCYSDLPFSKENPEAVDYYRCEDCGFNWICQTCLECCHAGHNVTGYLLAHRPTWACCYCPKKKTCTIKKT